MNEGLHVLTKMIEVGVPRSAERQRELLEVVSALEGVQEARLVRGDLMVSYVTETVNLRTIEAELERIGVEIRPASKKHKGFFGRFLEHMAESNYKSFGGQPLDCCTMHQKKSPQPRS